eukprot:4436805-Prorocentrum_lima.AAC.1
MPHRAASRTAAPTTHTRAARLTIPGHTQGTPSVSNSMSPCHRQKQNPHTTARPTSLLEVLLQRALLLLHARQA